MADGHISRQRVVELPRLDRAEFVYYVGWAGRLGMVDHWPVFECELHAALTLALGLHEIPADLDDAQATGVGDVHRRLSLQLLGAQSLFDPTTRWDSFLERLWSECRQVVIDPPVGSRGIAAPLEIDPPMLDDHDKPGIPLRILPWLERMQFQRSVTDTYRQHRPDDWPQFRAALHRTLSAAFGFNGSPADRDPSSSAGRIDRHHWCLGELLDQARQRFDPALQWEEFREIVWTGRDLGPIDVTGPAATR